MLWRNALITHPPLLQLLKDAEKNYLSPFESTCFRFQLQNEMRQSYGLTPLADPQDLMLMAKAEARSVMPNLTEKELDNLAQVRIETIRSKAHEIENITSDIRKGFLETLFMFKVGDRLTALDKASSDDAIETMMKAKLDALPPGICKEILKGTYLDRGEQTNE